MLKKILKITGISLISLIALAFIIPILFKKQITNLVKREINKSINAKVDFGDVGLSLFRHFPKMSISISGLSVAGIGDFEKDTLIAAKNLDASVNLWSLIKGKDIKVYGVYMESPRIHALVHKDGKANWDIAKADTAANSSPDSSPSAFKMNLQKYSISNGYLLYKDETAGINTEINGFDHEGKGDFTSDVFTLSTTTKASGASFNYANIPYLNNTNADINADIEINNSTSTYTFKNGDIKLNNLKLNADGFFQLVNDSVYKMDINFKSPSNDFKDILSLVPAIYKNDFDKIKTSGIAVCDGFVKGTYSPTQMPAYNLNLSVVDAMFQYPDLPKQVKNIQLTMHVDNPDGITDHTIVNIPKAHIEMDNEPFDFHLLFKNPETAQYIDAAAKGKIDLAQVSNFVKLENGTKLAGQVLADVFAKGNMSALTTQKGDFNAGGFLNISNLLYASNAFPQPIQNGTMKIDVANEGGIADKTKVNISQAHIELGKDPFDFSLQLSNPMTAMNFAGNAKGRFTLDNIKQFVKLDPGTAISGILNGDLSFSGNKAAIDKSEYDKINTAGTIAVSNMKYVSKDYPTGLTIAKTELGFNPKNVTLSNLAGDYLNTHFTASGALDNLIGYMMKNQTLKGVLNVGIDKMNLNDWMGSDTAASTTATASSAPFAIPANMNITLNAKAGEVKYDKVNYNNITGTLLLNDETVTLQNVKTDALDGTIAFNGSYSTKVNKKEPAIALSYDVKDVDIQKAFFAFNTVQKLMPVGQFLAGKLSSQLSMTGKLDGAMMPEFSSLSGNGNMLLLQGVLKKFAPLEKLASTLQIDDLKEVSVKDIKNYIEFKNGKVLVKPFNLKVKDIEMQIGGMHGFDQSIDYIIQMKVPRKYLGTQGNNLVNNLAAQATSKGIPVKLGDVVNLNVKMGGSVSNPSIKTDLKEVAGDAAGDLKAQATSFAQQKIDSTRNTVKDSLNVVKKQVTEGLKDEVTKQLFGTKDSTGTKPSLDSTKKKAESTIKNTLNGLFNKKKKQPADTTRH